jgi:hypothetical protein
MSASQAERIWASLGTAKAFSGVRQTAKQEKADSFGFPDDSESVARIRSGLWSLRTLQRFPNTKVAQID